MITPADASLDGKTAIVTGGARGIGRAIALGLASFGAEVAVCDRDEEHQAETVSMLEDLGRFAFADLLDVRNAALVDAFVARVAQEQGKIDIVVNNAAGTFHAHFMDVNAKGEGSLIAENFGSVTNFVRAAVPVMPAGGSIINVTSIEAHRAAPGFGVYAAMKAAVASLTKTLALELAPRGIRVNAVSGGVVDTDALEHFPQKEQMLEWGGKRTPAGRLVQPKDIADAVLFLCSAEAEMIVGQTIVVDGGFSLPA